MALRLSLLLTRLHSNVCSRPPPNRGIGRRFRAPNRGFSSCVASRNPGIENKNVVSGRATVAWRSPCAALLRGAVNIIQISLQDALEAPTPHALTVSNVRPTSKCSVNQTPSWRFAPLGHSHGECVPLFSTCTTRFRSR
ncbi:uncharacterized protein B0H18DRAFT_1029765 [Fomitopsis serialis]|uniref:uncharacterized protein n=1 Tax=Fomitopsis serialis TaxID=139415 RepID=UPI002008D7C0|nr:uncharacterized protein B0H18DRAFT_1029765 [Neoantrodia serialis]KAH9918972.1 hypothetical protein B0H18DRAFT_1029765 [Neoantrodia serialis]